MLRRLVRVISPIKSLESVIISPNRCYHLTNLNVDTKTLNESYLITKDKCNSKKLPHDVNPRGVFACNELDLDEVKVYGFDYDYTLAVYKPSLDYLLYQLGTETLINKYNYPKEIEHLAYEPGFAIRGLHYDIEKGLLMKLDSFLQIQLGTVYRGLTSVPDEEVLSLYKNKTIPLSYVETQGKNAQYNAKMIQLADLFSVPEMCLLCNIMEFFVKNNIDYSPEILFWDVKTAVGSCHPIMHGLLQKDISKYIEPNKGLRAVFERLKKSDKKLFLVTNSPYPFVNAGMSFTTGSDWEDFFDLVIVQARKPMFFTEYFRPIRVFDKATGYQLWDRVTSLNKSTIYCEGNINQLQELTGWRGSDVLYFGDHPYSDLADVTLVHGWRTGAIINELTHEISMLNDDEFKKNCNWLQMLTQLIEECQESEEPNAQQTLGQWTQERDKIRQHIKIVFNKQFGSVFRTFHNPTYFSRRLFRFADIYTSHISNLLDYSVKHTFYPRRGVMPHEYSSYFV